MLPALTLPASMKTKRHHPLRKRRHHLLKRRHVPAHRSKTRMLLRRVPSPIKRQAEASEMAPPPPIKHEGPAAHLNGANLVRSTVSDEDGSYLIMSIEVPVPFTVAYDAWTRFDEVPHFMRGTHLPELGDGSRMTWRVQTLFDQFAWQAQVCDQVPFEFITWKSVQGTPPPGFGSVRFEPISHQQSWIMVQVGFDMSGVYRWLGDPMPSLSQSLEQSLRRFHDTLVVQTLDEVASSPGSPC
jgi:uncharacterized membrane protein